MTQEKSQKHREKHKHNSPLFCCPPPLFLFPCGFLLGSTKTDANGSDTGSSNTDGTDGRGIGEGACTCTAPQIRRYLSRISGPLLDRVDIHIEMEHKGTATSKHSKRKGESSEEVRARVVRARLRQGARPGRVHQLNARLRRKRLRDACPLDVGAQSALDAAVEQFSLSRSRLESMLRVARTIADLEGSDGIETHHIEEAINYRPFDRKLFA